MTFEELDPFYEKHIKITCTDGTILTGFYDWGNTEYDNEPDPPSIDLINERKETIEVFLHNIAKVELIK